MARITVEDCIANVPNQFGLVLLAAHRARELSKGAEPAVPAERDKATVVALRELADGSISPERLRENLIARMRRSTDALEEVPDDDAFNIDRMADAIAETFGPAGDVTETSRWDEGVDEDSEERRGGVEAVDRVRERMQEARPTGRQI